MFERRRHIAGNSPSRFAGLVGLALFAVATAAGGAPAPLEATAAASDPDVEIARRRFEAGRIAYEAGDYGTALEHFLAARAVKPHPAFDFNIGRCEDRLEHPREAIAAYQRYLAVSPDAEDAPSVRQRVVVLDGRLAHAAARPAPLLVLAPASPPPAPAPALAPVDAPPFQIGEHRVAAIVGGVALASLLAGGVMLLSAVPDFHSLQARCVAEGCGAAEIQPLRSRVDAGYALVAIGAAAAAVDVGLWIYDLRRARGASVALVPAGPGVALSGRF